MSSVNNGTCIKCGGSGWHWPEGPTKAHAVCPCRLTLLGKTIVVVDSPALQGDIVFGPSMIDDTLSLRPDPQAAPPCQAGSTRREAKEHPWLAAQLYEKCPACRGTRKTVGAMMVDGVIVEGKRQSGGVAKGSTCPLCAETDGYCPVGMTVGQLERLLTEQLLCLQAVVRAEVFLSALKVDVEVKGVDSVSALRRVLQSVLDRVNKSDVTAARMRTAQAGKQRKEAAED